MPSFSVAVEKLLFIAIFTYFSFEVYRQETQQTEKFTAEGSKFVRRFLLLAARRKSCSTFRWAPRSERYPRTGSSTRRSRFANFPASGAPSPSANSAGFPHLQDEKKCCFSSTTTSKTRPIRRPMLYLELISHRCTQNSILAPTESLCTVAMGGAPWAQATCTPTLAFGATEVSALDSPNASPLIQRARHWRGS